MTRNLAKWGLALLLIGTACDARRAEPQAHSSGHERPTLRLLLVTDLEGVLEPCGCTSRPHGGIDRLVPALAAARAEGIPSATVFAGDVFFGPRARRDEPPMQDVYGAQTLAEVLHGLHVDAVAPGLSDMAQGPARLAALGRMAGAPLLSAGVTLDSEAPSARESAAALRGRQLLRLGEVRLGITSVVTKADARDWPKGGRGLLDPAVEAHTQVAALRRDGATVVLAIAQGAEQLEAVLAREAAPMLVVGTGLATTGEPAVRQVGSSIVVHGGHRGDGIVVLDLWLTTRPRSLRVVDERTSRSVASAQSGLVSWRYQAIEPSMPVDRAVRTALGELWTRVNAWNAHADAGPARPAEAGAGYVGSRTCAACHTQAFYWWKHSPHGQAYATLVARQRQLDLDCVGCHVTGYARPGGSTATHLDQLEGAGCESCHGPGAAHSDNPRSAEHAIQRAVPERVCLECHDAEHSDRFGYVQYRAVLRAPGHDAPTALMPAAARAVE
jgi:hypothetical protein